MFILTFITITTGIHILLFYDLGYYTGFSVMVTGNNWWLSIFYLNLAITNYVIFCFIVYQVFKPVLFFFVFFKKSCNKFKSSRWCYSTLINSMQQLHCKEQLKWTLSTTAWKLLMTSVQVTNMSNNIVAIHKARKKAG